MEQFTPGSALIGGALIGLAASVLLFCNGRVAGISGVVGGLLGGPGSDTPWRVAFVGGLLAGGAVLRVVHPGAFPAGAIWSGVTLVAGVLVGLGTQIGSGCTSGHGVCGLSRGSARSLVATLVFMGTGMLTVFVCRHLLGQAS